MAKKKNSFKSADKKGKRDNRRVTNLGIFSSVVVVVVSLGKLMNNFINNQDNKR